MGPGAANPRDDVSSPTREDRYKGLTPPISPAQVSGGAVEAGFFGQETLRTDWGNIWYRLALSVYLADGIGHLVELPCIL